MSLTPVQDSLKMGTRSWPIHRAALVRPVLSRGLASGAHGRPFCVDVVSYHRNRRLCAAEEKVESAERDSEREKKNVSEVVE